MHRRSLALHCAFTLLSAAYAWMMVATYAPGAGAGLTAIVIPKPQEQEMWKTVTADMVSTGATIPAKTHVFLHLPGTMAPVTRETLFGRPARTVRYWGYCFASDDPANPPQSGTLPGKVFLSEGERAARLRAKILDETPFTIFNPPTQAELDQRPVSGVIRHQLEIFKPGMTCYVMSELPLAVGLDPDGDGLNDQLEKRHRTNPLRADTDRDGVRDDYEIFSLHSDPRVRDTDHDGLIDGIEDKNRNGILNIGETDPTKKDSDSDGLCDGYCEVRSTQRICSDNTGNTCLNLPFKRWEGEDRNLSGSIDSGETDPRKIDTDDDGVFDHQEYYNCVLSGKATC